MSVAPGGRGGIFIGSQGPIFHARHFPHLTCEQVQGWIMRSAREEDVFSEYCTRLLIAYGAGKESVELESARSGRTCVCLAEERGRPETVRLLKQLRGDTETEVL